MEQVKEKFLDKVSEGLPLAGLCLLSGCQTYALLSPALRHAFLLLGGVLVAIYCLYHVKHLIQVPRVPCAFLVFCFVSEFYNLIHSAYPLDLRSGAFRLLCYGLLLCGAIVALRYQARRTFTLSWYGRVPLLCAWVIVAGAVILYLRDISSILAFAATQRFAGSEDLHPVGIAFGFGSCISVALAFVLFDSSWIFRLVNAGMVLLIGRGLVSTGSRGALLAVAIAGGVMALCMLKWATAKQRLFWILAAIAAAGGLALAVAKIDFLREQVMFFLNRFSDLREGGDTSSTARIELWDYYSKSFGSWFILGYSNYAGPYPHNLFYEFWLRFGLPGLFFSLMILGLVAWAIRFMWKEGPPATVAGLLSAMIFGFVNAQFNLSLEFNRALWLGLGCVFVLWLMRKDTSSKGMMKAANLTQRRRR